MCCHCSSCTTSGCQSSDFENRSRKPSGVNKWAGSTGLASGLRMLGTVRGSGIEESMPLFGRGLGDVTSMAFYEHCTGKDFRRKKTTASSGFFLSADRLSGCSGLVLENQLLFDTCRLAAAIAQVVKLGATNITATLNFDFCDTWAVQGECTLDTFAV